MAQQQQNDPWVEAAKNFKPQEGGSSAPEGGSDDWKLWQGGEGTEQPHGWGLSSIMAGTTPLHKAFDKATTVTPEQEQGHSPLVNRLQEFGAGAIQGAGQPLVHPWETLKGIGKVGSALMGNEQDADDIVHGIKNAPIAQTLGNVVGGAATGMGAEAAGGKLLAKIPSTARAGAKIADIESQAANTPVNFQNTTPALEKFGEHVATGGKGSGAISKLSNRISPSVPKAGLLDTMQNELNGAPPPAPPPPVNFPEARDFYTNVSDVTKQPGFLRRAFEDANEPRLRYAAGPVRAGMNADLTESLKPLNLDQDYNAALKEYARGKALQTGLRRAGTAAVGTAAGAAGLTKLHGIASSVFR